MAAAPAQVAASEGQKIDVEADAVMYMGLPTFCDEYKFCISAMVRNSVKLVDKLCYDVAEIFSPENLLWSPCTTTWRRMES